MNWKEIGATLYYMLLAANFLLILACLIYGYRLKCLCRLALWVNGIFVAVIYMVGAVLLSFVSWGDQAGIALFAFLTLPTPHLVEFLAFAAIHRWRMREPKKPRA